MEVTLQTDVEAGASGYSVTGGGKEGIFVKQVLKDSSAAKLFSMKEGDQLLSATIYFDNIKYEDALKILQYSEPYKVQFNIKRKLPSKDDTENVHHPTSSDVRETDQQGEGLTDGTMEAMEKMLEEEEDKEKLIVKSRTGRSQRPKKERLSWPKFQAKKTKKAVSHRRSHSTSDACEGRAPDLSPTSTDTELHFPREEMHLKGKKGSERKRKFLNIGFRMHRKPEIDDKIPKAGMTTAEARNKAAKDDQRISLDIQEPEMELGRLELQSAAGIPEHSGNEENKLKLQLQIESGTRKQEEVTSEIKATSGAGIGIPASVSGTLTGPHVSVRGRRKKSDDGTDTTKDTVSGRRHGLQTGKETRERSEDVSFGVQGLEIGIAKLTLQEPQEELAKGYEAPEIRVKIPTLQTPKFGFSKGKVSEAKGYVTGHEREQALGNVGEMLMETTPERNIFLPDVNGSGGKISVETPSLDHTSPSKTEKGTERSDWKAQKSSMKMPQMPEADVSSPKVDITIPSADVSQPKTGIQGPGTGIEGVKMEGEVKMGEKDMEGKESKFKMPKFKMPSFGWSPSKEKKGSVEVSLPKGEVDSSLKGKDKGGDLSLSLISSEIPKKGIDLSMKIQEEEVIVKDHKANDDMGIKGPKIQMPSIKIPQVSEADMEGAKVDISIPTVDVSLPKIKLNREDAGAEEERVNVKGDVRLKEKEGDHKESKFKIPRFSMPGFGWGGGKDIGSSVDGEANIKDTKMTITSYTLETEDNLAVKDKTVPTFEVDIEFPGGKTSKGEMHRVKMPSIKVPTLPDTQGKIEKSLTSEKMKTQEREIGLKMQGVESTDRKVKEKTERAVEIMENQKVEIKGIGIENKRPEGDIEIGKLKEKKGSVTIKGDMTKQSIKIVNTHLEGPKVDMKMPSVDVSIPKGKVDVKSPEIEVEAIKVEGKIKTGEKGDRKDSKFKRPKFKMPSFGVSAPSKEEAASVDVTLPKAELGEALLSVEGEVKGGDLSVEAPSVEVAVKGVDMERHLLEAEEQLGDLKGKTGGAGIKGHMPKVHIPSIKMPQMPKADIKGPKVDMTMPSVDVSLTKGKVDIKSTEIDVEGVKVEEDMKPGDKEVEVKDSKFKMAKFKMPSFGVSAPSKKGTASVDTNLPKADLDVYLPSIQGEVKGGDLSLEAPSVEVAVKGIDIDTHLPEGEVQLGDAKGKTGGAGIKGQMPKVHMPSIQMPQRPKADIKGPKVDITMPSVDVSFPKRKVEVKSPDVDVEGIKVEGDMKLGDQEEEGKDSKFKMPKFKMPSFGVSAPGKEGAASVDMNLPNAELDVSLPSVQGEVKGGDLSVRAPSVDLAVKGVDMETHLPEAEVQLGDLKGKTGGAGIKGHMPKVHMPSIKMPQMPKADIKGPKVDITMPSVDVSLPRGKVDIKSPDVEVEGIKVEGDMKLRAQDVVGKDSKFKMPKFKMPSFGVSAPSKDGTASVDITLSKADLDVSFPSVQGEIKGRDLNVGVPSVELAVKGVDMETHLPEEEVQLGDLKGKTGGAGIKGHMPKVNMPSMKMPQMAKADIKDPNMDITMPSVDMSLSKGKVDVKSPATEVEVVKVEGDMKLGVKVVEGKDSMFKMPKFKVPSFGSSPRKLSKTSVDSPSVYGDFDYSEPSESIVKGTDLSTSSVDDDLLLKDSKSKIDGSRMKIQMPKFSLPNIGFSKSEGKVSKSSTSIGSFQVDSNSSSLEISHTNLPAALDVVSPEIPSSNIPFIDIDPDKFVSNVQTSDIVMPESDFRGPQYEGSLKASDFHIFAKKPDSSVSLSEGETLEGELNADIAFSSPLDTPERHMQFPGVTFPGLSFTKINISGPHTETAKTRMKEDITLTKYEVILPMSGSHEASSFPQSGTITDLEGHSISLKTGEEPETSAGTGDSGMHTPPSAPPGTIKYPIFYKPKFGVSVSKPLEISHPQGPLEVAAEVTVQELPSFIPKREIMTSAETVTLPKYLSSVQTSQESSTPLAAIDVLDSDIALQTMKPEGVKPEGSESEGKEGFFKMPKFKLPSFSWSPKKEAASKGAPGSKPGDTSTMLDKGQTAADTETQTPHPDANIDVSTEKDGSKEKSKKTYFMMPKIGLSKVKGSTAGIGLQKEARGLTQPDDATTEEDNEKVTDTSGKIAVLDTEAVQVVVPAVMKQREMQVPEDRHSGKATAWESSGDKENVQMPKLGSSVAQVKSHNIHISIPKFEADVSPKSPKEDMETVVLETETYADVLKRNIDDKGLKLCQPTTISVSEVRVPSGENTIPLLMPSLGFSTGEMKAPRGETGEIVLPKHDMSMPGPQAIARGEEGIVGLPESKNYLLPTEGPIKLKTSSTEIPSQVSVIETGRVWEGSVLTIKFPKLQVPKFTFQAPNTEADIFIPKVREVMCPETDIEIAIHKESPDEWSAKVLKAVSEVPPQPSPDPIRPPKDLALSSVASPISKVKVHIQGAHVESQEVTIESRVTCEHGELPKRETFSTQIVRASEIPPSDIQTPSYGFSLLKVKIPESHVNLDVTGKEQETLGYTSSAFKTQDLSEVSLREDESGVDTVDLSLESELQPETGEPYEIISSSASLPKLKTFTFEVHSSHQYVDSCSDEEPAEILEFPPEESHGQTPPDEEEKEQKIQPESKKSSGLFRFWLPNIGFSSSVDEANSDPKTEASKSVPIETQPEAMPDPDPPKKPEKTGWFRFPKLGFSSSPAKKIQSTEESEAEPTKAGSQEEAEQTVIFFDAQETLSPEEREGGEGVASTTNDDAQEPGALVTSAARTELILLEEEGKTSGKTGSGHAAK